MNRRAFVAGLGAVLAAPLAVRAQQPKIPQIGFLSFTAWAPPLLAAFRQGLRDLGYVEGQNVGIEYRSAEEGRERLGPLAAELVRLKVDVIVAPTPIELKVAQQATKTIPIVMVTVGDPVANGSSAASPRLAVISQGFPA